MHASTVPMSDWVDGLVKFDFSIVSGPFAASSRLDIVALQDLPDFRGPFSQGCLNTTTSITERSAARPDYRVTQKPNAKADYPAQTPNPANFYARALLLFHFQYCFLLRYLVLRWNLPGKPGHNEAHCRPLMARGSNQPARAGLGRPGLCSRLFDICLRCIAYIGLRLGCLGCRPGHGRFGRETGNQVSPQLPPCPTIDPDESAPAVGPDLPQARIMTLTPMPSCASRPLPSLPPALLAIGPLFPSSPFPEHNGPGARNQVGTTLTLIDAFACLIRLGYSIFWLLDSIRDKNVNVICVQAPQSALTDLSSQWHWTLNGSLFSLFYCVTHATSALSSVTFLSSSSFFLNLSFTSFIAFRGLP
ncbi:hypothetical protein BO71DRAFT_430742 [Aspergillus ellipticus CBS 707.79]|uniref:Uncharacterized protein n=1 Tax=Aspergillus ellipticus CBS 707.79 TaxID=1448320 RepID=A0A319D911_9EURO|nr:hypothetical protein BO71DRAFT_430742 [Aspergillus ellipticus CBS 707.79]